MKNILMGIVIFVCFSNCMAQQIMHDNVTGKPYMSGTFDKTVGSPFLFEEWSPGVVYLKNGYRAEKFLLKLDAFNNELLFKYEEQPMAFVSPVKEFVINPVIDGSPQKLLFRCGYKPLEKNNESTYYQVLQDGPTALLKQVRKHIATINNYGSSYEGKEFVNTEIYFIAKPDGELVKIKKDKASMLAAINESSGKLETWANRERLRCKTEQEMMTLVRTFNENGYQQ